MIARLDIQWREDAQKPELLEFTRRGAPLQSSGWQPIPNFAKRARNANRPAPGYYLIRLRHTLRHRSLRRLTLGSRTGGDQPSPWRAGFRPRNGLRIRLSSSN